MYQAKKALEAVTFMNFHDQIHFKDVVKMMLMMYKRLNEKIV